MTASSSPNHVSFRGFSFCCVFLYTCTKLIVTLLMNGCIKLECIVLTLHKSSWLLCTSSWCLNLSSLSSVHSAIYSFSIYVSLAGSSLTFTSSLDYWCEASGLSPHQLAHRDANTQRLIRHRCAPLTCRIARGYCRISVCALLATQL